MEHISFCEQDNSLILSLHGRVDSATAEATEAEIHEVRAAHPAGAVILDAEDLAYISSAGLRVILRLRKAEPTLRIVGVNPDIYEIFEMTGFSEMIPLEKAYRRMSVEGCTVIGRGAQGTVYRYNNDTIIKVYRSADCLPDIRRERELARRAFVLGIPTAIPFDVVRVGDSFGSVFELLDAKSFSQLIAEQPDSVGSYAELAADLLRQIHTTEVGPDDVPDGKRLIDRWMEEARPYLDPADAEAFDRMVRDLPDSMNLLHCDFHTNNLLMQKGEALMIDMDTLSRGAPVIDLANVCFAYESMAEIDPENVEHFLGMPRTVYAQFWPRFLPRYLGTSDPDTVRQADDRIRLLAAVRLLRHVARRDHVSEEGRRDIAYCQSRIRDLIRRVDSLSVTARTSD